MVISKIRTCEPGLELEERCTVRHLSKMIDGKVSFNAHVANPVGVASIYGRSGSLYGFEPQYGFGRVGMDSLAVRHP